MKIHDYLWLSPFLSFLCAYFSIAYFYRPKTITTPPLIGKSILDAARITSLNKLHFRIISEKEDADLPDGTVISQSPSERQRIKEYQTIYLVCSCQKQSQISPYLIGKQEEEINQLLNEQRIRHKKFYLTSSYPMGYCIAQYPNANQLLTLRQMILYFSCGQPKKVLFPTLINQNIEHVIEYLTAHDIHPEVLHENQQPEGHTCHNCVVIKQKPLPGTIIDLLKSVHVQLYARLE